MSAPLFSDPTGFGVETVGDLPLARDERQAEAVPLGAEAPLGSSKQRHSLCYVPRAFVLTGELVALAYKEPIFYNVRSSESLLLRGPFSPLLPYYKLTTRIP